MSVSSRSGGPEARGLHLHIFIASHFGKGCGRHRPGPGRAAINIPSGPRGRFPGAPAFPHRSEVIDDHVNQLPLTPRTISAFLHSFSRTAASSGAKAL